MPRSFEIAFDDAQPYKKDTVTLALVPADSYTGSPVTAGVRAWLWDPVRARPLPDRLVRNLSGQLVLLNRPLDTTYTFRLDPRDAGYSGPFDVEFTPDDEHRRLVVWLQPRPDKVFDPGTTLVRGVVVRDGALQRPAEQARVVARPDEPASRPFAATTDERGGFAVAVRLGLVVGGEEPLPVPTTLSITAASDGTSRELDVQLDRGREHIFTEPIDLDGTNEPPFAERGST
jgi:hypothetical protein